MAVALAALLTGRASAQPFDITKVESQGRTLFAEIVDLDGDGRGEVLQVVSTGLPPTEKRTLRVYRPNGRSIPSQPVAEAELPDRAAAYDLGDVLDDPGVELLLLQRRGVTALNLGAVPGGPPRRVVLPVPGGVSLGPSEDERGLDRLRIAVTGFGETWMLVPGLGEAFFLSADGRLRAQLDVGGRSNYFIQPPGALLAESDIQLYYDAPRISVGDVDGDGAADVMAGSRHELRVFLRKPDGSFSRQADRVFAFGRVSKEDHIRGSGSVRSVARDIDGDGLVDLLISATSGGITDSKAKSSIHFNQGGRWNLEAPDAVFESEQAVTADDLVDLDGDGRLEFVRYVIPINVLELVEIFVTRAIDANMEIYALTGERSFGDKPRYRRKLDVPLNFDTSRPVGFIPSFEFDLNGDGRRDYLGSTDGTAIEVFLADENLSYRTRHARQKVATEGVVREGDVDGDGLPDLVIFNPHRYDQPFFIAINSGTLPGTEPRLGPRPD